MPLCLYKISRIGKFTNTEVIEARGRGNGELVVAELFLFVVFKKFGK